MPIPNPVRLFHITAIANLQAICQAGALQAKNRVQEAGRQYSNIAYQGAQGARAVKAVPNPPGGRVHDFVPFYFAPRSPMLFAINGGRVPGCDWRQADIVHLETSVEGVTAGGNPFVFYDCNATLAWSTPYTDLARLDAVAWDLITETPQLDGFCKFWQSVPGHERYTDRMERRQAEFLVRDSVALTDIVRIGVINSAKRAEVQAILTAAGVHCVVEVKPDWYF
ncbi:MAG: DUF4433 domain-containing protein [Moraxellaceae bacterium]|nr:DUF4433 domain-containing protein [Moraxellaceae bacterium]